uniref:Uncharacterized protein n=1 Tax=Globodera rostochiensis TaxID=31243 RepID=A0A914I282_GLORO
MLKPIFVTLIHAFLFAQSFAPKTTSTTESEPTTVHKVKKLVELSLLPKWAKNTSRAANLVAISTALQEQDSTHLVENGEKLARFIKEFGFYNLVEDKLFKEIEGQSKSFKKFFKKFTYKNEVKTFANDFLHYQNLLSKMPETSRIDATVSSGATVIGQLAGLRYYALLYQALLAELDKPRNASGTTTAAEKAWLKRWLRYSVAAIKASFNVVKNGMEDMLNADIYSHKMPTNSVQRKSNQQLLQTLDEWSAKLRR